MKRYTVIPRSHLHIPALHPLPMTPEQVRDLVERVRATQNLVAQENAFKRWKP